MGVLVILSVPGIAFSHRGHRVEQAERYIKLDFQPDHVRIVCSWVFSPGQARPIVRAADLDHNGSLSDREVDTWMAEWTRATSRQIEVLIDREVQSIDFGEGYLSQSGRRFEAPLTAEVTGRIDHAGGRRRFAVVLNAPSSDRVHLSLERTDVKLVTHTEVALLAADLIGHSPGRRPDAFETSDSFEARSPALPKTHFYFGSDPDSRTVVVDVEAPSPNDGPTSGGLTSGGLATGGLAIGLLALAAISLVLLVRIRYRRRRPTSDRGT